VAYLDGIGDSSSAAAMALAAAVRTSKKGCSESLQNRARVAPPHLAPGTYPTPAPLLPRCVGPGSNLGHEQCRCQLSGARLAVGGPRLAGQEGAKLEGVQDGAPHMGLLRLQALQRLSKQNRKEEAVRQGMDSSERGYRTVQHDARYRDIKESLYSFATRCERVKKKKGKKGHHDRMSMCGCIRAPGRAAQLGRARPGSSSGAPRAYRKELVVLEPPEEVPQNGGNAVCEHPYVPQHVAQDLKEEWEEHREGE